MIEPCTRVRRITRTAALLASAVGVLHALTFSHNSQSVAGATNSTTERPLPDVASLIREVHAHQKELDAVRRNYIYREIVQIDQLEGDGEVKHGKVEEREVFYIGGHHISRLLRKDGHDLSPSEQKKEEKRVSQRIEKYKKKEAQREKDLAEGKDSGSQLTIETFLRICRFTNPRRVALNGRDAIVFDFSGNPESKTHGMAENALKKLIGTVWIDEESREVNRMELRFGEAFKVGGGLLASVQKGSKFVFEQALVNNEVWLPTYAEADLRARVLLVKGLREHEVTHYGDYRKFRADSVVHPVDEPKQ